MSYKRVFEKNSPLEHPQVKRVVEIGRALDIETYLVGGYIRDVLWKRVGANPKDLDFAVRGGSAMEFARRLSAELAGHFVPLDIEFDTARVVLDDGSFIDFAGCVGGNIETDLRRRDFTINALALDCSRPDCIIDLFDGLDDIENRTIRAISREVLLEDPLRLLRAFRFRAALKATIEPATLGWIKENAQLIDRMAAERINAEMFTLLTSDNSGEILKELGQCGLLEAIYPELVATRKVTPNAYHHLGLFDHSIEAVSQLERKLPELPAWVHQSNDQELSHGVTRLAATKLAALLHDIGKPSTWQINEEGRHTFYGHDSVGAIMAEETAERMKWSKPINRFISKLIKWHLRPGALFHQGEPTPKAVQRFYRKLGDDLPELMVLAFGDLGATRGDGLPESSRHALNARLFELLVGYKAFVDEVQSQPRLLGGHDVIRIIGIKPGPLVGEILEALDEAQGLKEVTDTASAEKFVVDYHNKKYSS